MKKTLLALGCSVMILTACKNENKESTDTLNNENNEMAEDIKNDEGEWISLFNGENLEGWKAYGKDSISSQWKVKDNALVFTPAEERSSAENLITTEEYENFELSLEWKISEGGNSGIMWAVQDDGKYNEPYYTGPEIQVLDNERHPDAKNGPNRTAGALYDMVPPSKDVAKPAGEWNKTIIHIDHEANEGYVELNGTRIVEFPVEGEAWKEMVSKSKFKDWEDFGTSKSGHIALQDHGNKVSYKDIKLRKL